MIVTLCAFPLKVNMQQWVKSSRDIQGIITRLLCVLSGTLGRLTVDVKPVHGYHLVVNICALAL